VSDDAALALSSSPLVAAGHRYWLSKHRDGRLPGRDALDPMEMRQFLSNVALVDVQPDPLDFRYRLIGTAITKHLFRDYTSTWMSEIDHQKPGSTIFENCREVVKTQKPLFNATPYVGPDREFLTHQEIIAPLIDASDNVAMLFVVIEFIRLAA
jgi:hypothetical protein